ncbi:carotenoid biosynthesis protein [Parvicella tangerina]|uniref:Carotenoid biosynthesis protein n=1 Tax=Parvicella tangerina TaxID=2829795 RepID=A0A916NEC4_9FLAO|nr:carotenoid biosynthesis protein [Parvicella tangerina]CAG5086522.1 hypothetical protein CRYO30217_03157 [Parvicella tangerina]
MLQQLVKYKFEISLLLLVIFYGVGLTGMLVSDNPQQFAQLSWLNLIISAVVLFANHENWKTITVLGIAAVAILGFFIEVLGVKTGEIFGVYSYGNSLGVKVLDVPLVIGLNWAMLCYFSVYTFSRWFKKWYVVPFFAAVSLVLLDFIIEPVAVKLDFWSWSNPEIPIQNYVAWFVLAAVFNKVIMLTKAEGDNKVAIYLFIIQMIFFTTLRIAI